MFKALHLSLAWLTLFFPVSASAADLVLDARSNYLVDATINGHPVRSRVDPEASGYVVLNPEAVARVGLRRSMLRSQTRIGPVRLTGSSKVAEISIGGVTGDRRVVWIDRPAIDGADGLISPADMHYEHVTFQSRAARAGESSFEVPMTFERGFGLYHLLAPGEPSFRFKFSLIKPHSLATAGAGAELAIAYGGTWAGEATDQVIDFGVARPVRAMTFGRPVDILGFRLGGLRVRTGDNRGDLSLPPDPNADPDEVVVTGRSRQRATFVVHVGLDRLSSCSSLVWNNLRRRMTLHCTNP